MWHSPVIVRVGYGDQIVRMQVQGNTPRLREFTSNERDHAAAVVGIMAPVVPGLARALAPRTEVVLHDLTLFPHSIAAIAEPITGRSVGGPPTDLGLTSFVAEPTDDLIGYRTEHGSTLTMRSSSLFFRAPSGRTVVALCINTDINGLERAQEFLAALAPRDSLAGGRDSLHESFPVSVDELAHDVLRDAMAIPGVGVEFMKKSHKMQVVKLLDERGFFALRESVELAAASLDVSRYSIYKYLNEIRASDSLPSTPDSQSGDW